MQDPDPPKKASALTIKDKNQEEKKNEN